jgi:hypothetical protein
MRFYAHITSDNGKQASVVDCVVHPYRATAIRYSPGCASRMPARICRASSNAACIACFPWLSKPIYVCFFLLTSHYFTQAVKKFGKCSRTRELMPFRRHSCQPINFA